MQAQRSAAQPPFNVQRSSMHPRTRVPTFLSLVTESSSSRSLLLLLFFFLVFLFPFLAPSYSPSLLRMRICQLASRERVEGTGNHRGIDGKLATNSPSGGDGRSPKVNQRTGDASTFQVSSFQRCNVATIEGRERARARAREGKGGRHARAPRCAFGYLDIFRTAVALITELPSFQRPLLHCPSSRALSPTQTDMYVCTPRLNPDYSQFRPSCAVWRRSSSRPLVPHPYNGRDEIQMRCAGAAGRRVLSRFTSGGGGGGGGTAG
ncbi:hypothetical protein BDN71DRAFT_985811 [Pleurotus eryngii]|uniref:Uncharacterized protein n=1 Tax=Pleurotus eryngii TaxID=5323 RepID=A0A9P5ZUT2_PLEER|nr:hypothetical protein BDN71DRAFT_985811 [Pleurotus eryngii]